MNQSHKAVVLGMSPTGLYAVRELGRAEVDVIVCGRESGPAQTSKFARSSHLLSETVAVDQLLKLCPPNGPKPVLIPTSDQDVDLIQRHARNLSEAFLFQRSYADGSSERLMAKDRLYKLCREIGIVVPRSWDVERVDVTRLSGDVPFPCLIKPSRIDAVKASMAGRKLWTCSNPAQFVEIADRLPEGDTRWLVQEIVPGPDSNISLWAGYRDREGCFHQETTARKLRQFPPGFGSASLVRTMADPETAESSRRLLAAAGYHGIAATEFKRDPRDGTLKIIEMNPRPSLWFGVTHAAGRYVTSAAYRDLSGEDFQTDSTQHNGVEWRYGLKDHLSLAFYHFKRDFVLPAPELGKFGSASSHVSAVFCWDDPKPTWSELQQYARKIWLRSLS